MSLMARLFRPRASVTTSADLEMLLRSGGMETDSGAIVNAETAMRVAAAYACVRVLAETVAQVPLIVYRRTATGKERATDHWLHRLLHDEPNPWQTSVEFREMMQAHMALRGNAFALKTVVRGEVRELLPVVPDRVRVEQEANYRVLYHVAMPDGRDLPVPADRMFHPRGLSLNGVSGISPVGYQREALGLALQLQKHGARMFRNGALVGGVLEHPLKLSKDAGDRLRSQFDERYAGVDNAHKTLLLEEGMKFTAAGMTAEDSQFLESRKYQRSEIAAMFRVPLHMIGDLERATFSNIEHQDIGFTKYTMAPWFRRWESRIARDLVQPAERDTVFAEFLMDGLMRGDYKSRTDGYATAVTNGWMNRNEVRELENMNRVDGLDEFLTPMNMDDASSREENRDEPQPTP